MATLKNTIIDDTGYLQLPSGTTAQRLSTPSAGYTRWNLNNETFTWESPIEYPNDGNVYTWNEETTSWVLDNIE